MEPLKHECGVAMIRLLKPLEYYQEKYGTWMFGLNKLYLMMEKQHNRGQEGAGMSCVKLDGQPGSEYMFRERAEGKDAITEIFGRVQKEYASLSPELLADADFAKEHLPFAGELYMGHLRYSTTGKKGLSYVHPFLRRNNWQAKNICICGNFNMTNIDEIFQKMLTRGMFPRIYSDGYTLLELMGHRLDREAERNFVEAKAQGLDGMELTHYIDEHMDMANVLKTSMPDFDGGYVMCGLTGSGEMFSIRDPWGIRPAFYYAKDKDHAEASGDRVATNLDVFKGDKQIYGGRSTGATQDMNDVLTFKVEKNQVYTIKFMNGNGVMETQNVEVGDQTTTLKLYMK